MMSLQQESIRQAIDWLRQADGLLVAAGAGMGVDSGLPDFRGDDGLWRAYPALRASHTRFESIANPAAFERDPERAWGFYGHRLQLYRKIDPHPGFAILRGWAERMKQGGFVFTSNVDGHFQRSGFSENRVVEHHGSIHYLQCCRPCSPHIWAATDFAPQMNEKECRLTGPLPRCARCGALARPNILMFGDAEWLPLRAADQKARLDRWVPSLRCPVVVELGAGRALPTVRRFSERHAPRVIRINTREPEINPAFGIGIQGGALDVLKALNEALDE
jgi:NAD-dependent SIR2 family protein deacetylase